MELANIAQHYLPRFKTQHGSSTTQDQWSALNAILGCRTGQYGEMVLSCQECPWQSSRYRSCGHRACNQCQNHSSTQWLERQTTKLLPVDYFMVTFTLPAELRGLAKANQKVMYSLLFDCAISTLKTFGINDKELAAELAATAVLHTHSRRLDYHPHVHLIVPAGGINKRRNQWRKIRGKYLFNEFNLAAVFRGRMLAAIAQAGFSYHKTPTQWVAQCKQVGRGLPAIKYLSRYLYRGVISNDNIIFDDGDFVTFQYQDSATNQMKTRTMRGEDFVALILQHTLPKGFRRARDYGFLHGNAKRLLKTVQWILQVSIPKLHKTQRPKFICKLCHGPMSIIGFWNAYRASG
ncbi:MAG: transposase [Proteobacteria bacterium]|nr:transposase [Pseudomonadota bacterium]